MIVRPSTFRLFHLASKSPCIRCQNYRVLDQSNLFHFTTPSRRTFSASSPWRDSPQPINHYEILGVKPDATKAELKKQFYKLSKETHPDLHKNDPTASERFSQISESYSLLANDEKRRRYDRDFMRQNKVAAGRSSSYAGSRPASGLSKRRGVFRGAPQSFYAQGGYGNTGRQSQNTQQSSAQAGTFNASAFTEPGRYDPEFDSNPIYKTQSVEDEKRRRRMQAAIDLEAAQLERGDAFWIRFVVVTTIVVGGITLGAFLLNMKNAPRGGLTRADGSRRDGPRNEWAKG